MGMGFSGVVPSYCLTLAWENFCAFYDSLYLIFLAAFMDQGFKQEIFFMLLM